MPRDLRDFTLCRQSELSRTLAGCAIVDPALVVELVRKLRPADLTDEQARKFLTALTPEADPFTVARELGLTVDYARWLALGCDELPNLRQAAQAAANEIKSLVVTRDTISELQTWYAVARAIGRHL